jgi:ABC-type polysaccharide transport system permease subunit
LGLPIAVILALMLHEVLLKRFRTLVQTIVYLPHFLSWVIMFGVLLMLLSPNNGLINNIIKAFGGDPIAFLTSPEWFRSVVVVLSDIWKETGWSTIIYLAALLSISPHLYEAATVDGANHFQRIWHISLPGIMSVIVMVTLLRLGNILDAGFNQIFVLYSVPVYSVGDIIDTWVYRQGILQFQFSLATAVGLFKGVIGLVLIIVANGLPSGPPAKACFRSNLTMLQNKTRDVITYQIFLVVILTAYYCSYSFPSGRSLSPPLYRWIFIPSRASPSFSAQPNGPPRHSANCSPILCFPEPC